jgi:hypothetical protein
MRRLPSPQQFRHAVLALCRLRARQRVKDQIRAKGLKPQHYTARALRARLVGEGSQLAITDLFP